jgi:cytochrome b561
MMVFLPTTGIGMGYYSGYGVALFGIPIIPGKKEKVPTLAGYFYTTHKWVGTALEYVVPIHISAAGFHALKGQNALARMNPFK